MLGTAGERLTISFKVWELLAQEFVQFLTTSQQFPDPLSPIRPKWSLEARSLCLQVMTPPPIGSSEYSSEDEVGLTIALT